MKKRIVDSTRYQTYFNCPTERRWFTEYKGRGITLSSTNVDMLYGLAVHNGCEMMAVGHSFVDAWNESVLILAQIPSDMRTPDGHWVGDEYQALLYGHLRIYEEYILPKIKSEYKIIGVEQEIVIPLTKDLSYCTRVDIILQEKNGGLYFVPNYKTSSYMNDLLLNSKYSTQLMMEAEAARHALKTNITGSIVIGFDKGQKRGVSDTEAKAGKVGKRLMSPFVYCYMKGDDPWLENNQVSVDYKYGWSRVPIWSTFSYEDWWDKVPERIKLGSYSILPPIYHDPEFVEDIKKQIISVEERIANDPTFLLPMNLHNCTQHAGYMHHNCPYIPLCHDREFPEDLIGGMYKWREINHPHEDDLVAHPEYEEE
jgi:hypothetical protein